MNVSNSRSKEDSCVPSRQASETLKPDIHCCYGSQSRLAARALLQAVTNAAVLKTQQEMGACMYAGTVRWSFQCCC